MYRVNPNKEMIGLEELFFLVEMRSRIKDYEVRDASHVVYSSNRIMDYMVGRFEHIDHDDANRIVGQLLSDGYLEHVDDEYDVVRAEMLDLVEATRIHTHINLFM